ncbi:MAG: hypothetical protein ACK559_27280, partial [bacterium]
AVHGAEDLQRLGAAGRGLQAGCAQGFVQSVLGHLAIGGPFPAHHADKAVRPRFHHVLAADLLAGDVLGALGVHKRALPGKGRQHIAALRDALQVAPRVGEDEVDFLFRGL